MCLDMQLQTKFLRLREPLALGDCIDNWCVCWLGGWHKCRVFFVVMVEREGGQPAAPCNAIMSPSSLLACRIARGGNPHFEPSVLSLYVL